MKRAFIFLTALTILVFSVADAIAKGQKPSEEMIRILLHYKSGPNDLDVKGLDLDQTMNFPSQKEKPEYEVYRVPYPDGVADVCVYSVLLHSQTGHYWIHRWDCGAGVSQFYGPGQVKELPKS